MKKKEKWIPIIIKLDLSARLGLIATALFERKLKVGGYIVMEQLKKLSSGRIK